MNKKKYKKIQRKRKIYSCFRSFAAKGFLSFQLLEKDRSGVLIRLRNSQRPRGSSVSRQHLRKRRSSIFSNQSETQLKAIYSLRIKKYLVKTYLFTYSFCQKQYLPLNGTAVLLQLVA